MPYAVTNSKHHKYPQVTEWVWITTSYVACCFSELDVSDFRENSISANGKIKTQTLAIFELEFYTWRGRTNCFVIVFKLLSPVNNFWR